MTSASDTYHGRFEQRWALVHPRLAVVGAYFLLALVFAGELLLPSRSLYRWDTLLYNWPILLDLRAQLLSGYLPFWSDAFCCGTPLLENLNAGVFYPLRLPCWFLPLKPGYHLFLFVHVWLSLVAMHLLLRRGFALGHTSCVVGALAFALGGYARGMWDTHNFMALPWLPLATVALLEARHSNGFLRAMLGTAIAWSMLLLCGDFQAAILWVPIALLLGLLLPERRRLLLALSGSVALALLLTAPQWVPASVVAADSYRAGGIEQVEAWEHSLHPVRLLEFVVPFLFGTRGAWLGSVLAGEGAVRTTPWATSIHVGIISLLAAFFSLKKVWRNPVVRWGVLVLVGSLLLSFGRFFLLFELWHQLPVVENFRYPQKYILWSTFALAVLAAQGTPVMLAYWQKHATFFRWIPFVLVAVVIGIVCIFALKSEDVALSARWLMWRMIPTLTVLVIAAVILRRGFSPVMLRAGFVGLLVLELGWAWYVERPTTSSFNPMDIPAVAKSVRGSSPSSGRLLCDMDLDLLPLPSEFGVLSRPEKDAAFYKSALRYNSPRLWGLRSAAGFSPTESRAMRTLRLDSVEPADGNVDVADSIDFMRRTAVRWWLTTRERAKALSAMNIPATEVSSWGKGGATVLMRLDDVSEALVESEGHGPAVVRVWRARPGRIRVDLRPGNESLVIVRETYAQGWRATDGYGAPLVVTRVDDAFVGIHVPAGVNQIRLAYEPVQWRLGVFLFGLGLFIWLVLCSINIGWSTVGLWFRGRVAMAVVIGTAFVVMGSLARSHWSCTFDEGFHVTRGLARVATGDSRLSYYHPPLQNGVCGYFANLAWGDGIELPSSPGWQEAEIFRYSTEWASMHADVFPEAVRAARTGTMLFGLMLCLVGALWARRIAGPAAGWVAGVGLALNPTILAHGNLVTSDMGVTALVLSGTAAAWWGIQASIRQKYLALSSLCFALAAVAKFTGLIWFLAYLLLVIPVLAIIRREPRIWLHGLLAAVLFVGALLCVYGWMPQRVRVTAPAVLIDAVLPAGRYLEGLFRQGMHALEGQRAFFVGHRFTEGSWWHLPAAAAVKTPLLWTLAIVAGVSFQLVRHRAFLRILPWVPALCFGILLFSANRLAIGVRHVLPLLALAVVVASVWAARLRSHGLRRMVVGLLLVSGVVSAVASYPNYISYTASWAGHTGEGYRYVVDSNYDWGQDAEKLESQWAALTDANRGRPTATRLFWISGS